MTADRDEWLTPPAPLAARGRRAEAAEERRTAAMWRRYAHRRVVMAIRLRREIKKAVER